MRAGAHDERDIHGAGTDADQGRGHIIAGGPQAVQGQIQPIARQAALGPSHDHRGQIDILGDVAVGINGPFQFRIGAEEGPLANVAGHPADRALADDPPRPGGKVGGQAGRQRGDRDGGGRAQRAGDAISGGRQGGQGGHQAKSGQDGLEELHRFHLGILSRSLD